DAEGERMTDPGLELARSSRTTPAPRFTLLMAVYGVAEYLPDFLASLDAQDSLADVELIFVSDSSPDESERIISAWVAATDADAVLLRQPNGGPGSARNLGLARARGEWVSFPDPDDAYGPGYLAAVRSALDSADPAPSFLACRRVRFSTDPSATIDDHALGYRFWGGARTARLEEQPRYFHTHVSSGFYQRRVIEENGLRFEPRLRAAFDDAAFAGWYSLATPDPDMATVPDARYLYRQRVDGSSVVGGMWAKPDKYTAIPEFGYLPLLRARPAPPLWVQNLVLYDLEWFFIENEREGHPTTRIDEATRRRFLELLDEVLALLDERTLWAYSPHALALRIRMALTVRKTGRLPWQEARVREGASGVSIAYFSLTPPEERLYVDGVPRSPAAAATESIEYFGKRFLYERRLETAVAGAVVLEVGGRPLVFARDDPGHLGGVLYPWSISAGPHPAAAGDAGRGALGGALRRLRRTLGPLARRALLRGRR
ncbi:MAG: epsJ 2, partial [Naasia sp.]|nr:epsJ 2 [Naasia sp.]